MKHLLAKKKVILNYSKDNYWQLYFYVLSRFIELKALEMMQYRLKTKRVYEHSGGLKQQTR